MSAVGFEDRLTFVVSGPNVATPRNRDTSVTATGMGSAGVSAIEAIANWWVVGVNPAGGTISLVKVDDSLPAINTQVLVVSITPKA